MRGEGFRDLRQRSMVSFLYGIIPIGRQNYMPLHSDWPYISDIEIRLQLPTDTAARWPREIFYLLGQSPHFQSIKLPQYFGFHPRTT